MILKSTITVTYNDESELPYTACMDWCEPAPGIIIGHLTGAGGSLSQAIADLAITVDLHLSRHFTEAQLA